MTYAYFCNNVHISDEIHTTLNLTGMIWGKCETQNLIRQLTL